MSNIAQTAIPIQSSLMGIPKIQRGGFPMILQSRTPQLRDWRYVAEQIRDEKDSKKMMDLVQDRLDNLVTRHLEEIKNGAIVCNCEQTVKPPRKTIALM